MMNFIFDVTLGTTLNSITLPFNSEKEAENFFTMEPDCSIPVNQITSKVYFQGSTTPDLENHKLMAYQDQQCFTTDCTTVNLEQLITFLGEATWSYRYDLKEEYYDSVVSLRVDSFDYAGLSEDAYQQLSDTALYTADEERCFLTSISNSIYEYAGDFEDKVVNPLERFYYNYIESVVGYKTISETYDEVSTLLENLISFSKVFEKYAYSYDELYKVI